MTQQSASQRAGILSRIPGQVQGEAFANLSEEVQMEVYSALSKQRFAQLFACMPSHQRVAFYQQLDDKEQTKLLPFFTKKVREDVITLSAYSADTAGGVMSTDFATVLSHMTVKQAISKLRQDSPSKKMIYYIYVVDRNMKMIGFVSLKDLIMAHPTTRVERVLHRSFVCVHVQDDREYVAKQVERHDLVAIPVLNQEEQLLGIVRYDDAMDVIQAEHTEDMEKFMGIISNDNTSEYFMTSIIQHFRRRVFWIVGLFMASIFSEAIIHYHEAVLAKTTVLALYLPMIAASGGNAGSQSATVVIRAISLGQAELRNWFRILIKEARIALLLSVCLFFMAFVKVFILSRDAALGAHTVYDLAFAIALSLSLQVVTSTVIGAALPLVAKYYNGDPAVAASPAIATLVDITGMAIYFTVAVRMLS